MPSYSVLTPAITGGPNSMKDGRPGTQEDARIEHVVPAAVVQTGSYTMIIEVSANGMFGVGMDDLRYNVPVVSTPPSEFSS